MTQRGSEETGRQLDRADAACRPFALICGLVTVLAGLLTIIGWITGIHHLASVRAKYIPMAPATALAFASLGFALVLHISLAARVAQARIIALIAAVAVIIVSVIKLIEFSGYHHFGIEELLLRNPEMFGRVLAGRMSPITAVTFFLAGTAMVMLILPRVRHVSGVLASAGAIIGLIVVLGYLYGTPLLYGGTTIPMALPTAIAFLCVSTGMIAAGGSRRWPLRLFAGSSARALLLRAFVPVIVGALLINGWVRHALLVQLDVNPAIISSLSAIIFAFITGLVITQVAAIVGGQIDRAEAEREKAREQLRALNAELENRVLERTRELRDKNAQMEEELAMAREMQLAMLPRDFPSIPREASPTESAIRFFSFYFPTGAVSGDFFDIIPVSDTAVGVFICDVMGHGVRSALVTSMLRALIEEHHECADDPGALLTKVNRSLFQILQHSGTTIFASSFYLVADAKTSCLRYANAGHPRPLHIRRSECDAVPLTNNGSRGPAMGIFKDSTYGTVESPIVSGDIVMLFTDGLFEVESAENGLYSEQQLHAAVRRRATDPPEKLFERVLGEITAFAGKRGFDDDVCIVGLELKEIIEPVEPTRGISG
jgi:serine phosphatase RsbU (regulator of sigma subunit)